MLVAAVAPFERALPGSIFGFTLTTVELTIVIALAIGAIAWVRQPAAFEWRTPISLPLAAIVASAIVAAVAAPEFQRQRRSRRRAPGDRGAVVHPGCQRRQERSRREADRRRAPRLGIDCRRHRRPGAGAGSVGARTRSRRSVRASTSSADSCAPRRRCSIQPSPRCSSRSPSRSASCGSSSSRLAFAGLVLTGAGVIATFTRSGLITITMSLALYGGRALSSAAGSGAANSGRLAVLAAVLVALVLMSRSPQMLLGAHERRRLAGLVRRRLRRAAAADAAAGQLQRRRGHALQRGPADVAVDRGAAVFPLVPLPASRHRRRRHLRRPADTVRAAGRARRRGARSRRACARRVIPERIC